jgi:hypothetical protein
MIDISGIKEEEKNKIQPGIIKTIKKEIYIIDGYANWYYIIVIKDARNIKYIKIVYKNETEF